MWRALARGEAELGKDADTGNANVHRRCRPTQLRAEAARSDATDEVGPIQAKWIVDDRPLDYSEQRPPSGPVRLTPTAFAAGRRRMIVIQAATGFRPGSDCRCLSV